jgi:predicted TIM-barrel fold metal-dependent hydrolase
MRAERRCAARTDRPVIPLVDTHHHLWDLSLLPYEWLREQDPAERELLGEYSPICTSYLIEDYLADIEGSAVTKSVHIQANYSGRDPVEETAWLQGLADVHGYPHGIIAYCDLTASDVGDQLDRHCAYPNMRGVRTFAQGDELLDPAFQRGIAELSRRQLLFEFHVGWQSMEIARDLARRHPDMSFVLEHAGLPWRRDDYQDWRLAIRQLATMPNVRAKISGLGMTDHHWSVSSIEEWVTAVIAEFGIARSMIGSNWPVDSLYSDYRTFAAAYRTIVAEFSPDEQQRLLHANAERWYRL